MNLLQFSKQSVTGRAGRVLLMGVTLSLATFCAVDTGDLPEGDLGSGHSGRGSGSGNGGADPGAGGLNPGEFGSGGGFVTEPGRGGEDDAGTCQEEATEGEQLPLDMFIMFDISGSMNDEVDGSNRLNVVRNALTSFLNDPASAGIGTGIGYFPAVDPNAPTSCTVDADCDVPGVGNYGTCTSLIPFVNLFGCAFPPCGCTGADICAVDVYATPAVPIMLPANPAPVVTSLQAQVPNGFTPLRQALEGAHQYAGTWASQNPGRKTVVVLVGDGEPQGCAGNSIQEAQNVVQAALNGPQQVPTFVIGVGPSLENLNRVAEAGGTGAAYLMSDADVGTKFKEAMDDIRGRAIPCDVVLSDTEELDPDRVNIEYVPRGGTEPVRILRTSSGAADTCGAEGGWYYDDPANPTQISMCPTTCTHLTTGGGRQFTIKVGCMSEKQDIH